MAKAKNLDRVFRSKIDLSEEVTSVRLDWIKKSRTSAIPELFNQHADFQEIENGLREKRLRLSPELAAGIELAKKEIQLLQKDLGIKSTDLNLMKVILLSTADYDDFAPEDTLGVSLYPINSVFLKKEPGVPKYQLAAAAFHELSHRWLEITSLVYSHEKKQRKSVDVAIGRSGLISFYKKEKGDSSLHGYLLNEMGTCYLEKQFMHKLLKLNIFYEEKLRDLHFLKANLLKPNDFVEVRIDGGFDVDIHASNILFLFDQMDFWYINQLVEDLHLLTGDINGESLGMALVRCKVDPKHQNVVRKKIDSVMGAGFYSRLRSSFSENDEIIYFLVEVQEKIRQASKNR